jgi:hypothetical protein
MQIAPDTTKSGLDEIFFQGYEQEKQPGEVRADHPLFFRQKSTTWGTEQYAESQGPGDYNVTAEDEAVEEATVRVGNKTSREVLEFDKDIPISQRYQEDSEHYGTVDSWVLDLGVRGRTTRDKYAFRNTWGNPFDATNNPTPDGAAMVSNTHTLLSGDTQDNLETGALTPDNLATLVRRLRLQKAQDGDLGSYHADGILCPVALHPTAMEITKSELKSQTPDNDLNYWSTVYPGLQVGASEFLDSDFNTLNANANTSYFVVSRMHKVTRSKRKELSTEYVEPKYDRKRRAFYRARFREISYPGTSTGFAGSNGTTA